MKKLVAMVMVVMAMMVNIGCSKVAEEVEYSEPQRYISYGVTDGNDSVVLFADEFDEALNEIEPTHGTDGVEFDGLGECNFEVRDGQYVYVALNDNGTPTDISDDFVVGCVLDVETNIYNELEENLRGGLESKGYKVERDGNNIHISIAE